MYKLYLLQIYYIFKLHITILNGLVDKFGLHSQCHQLIIVLNIPGKIDSWLNAILWVSSVNHV